MVKIANVMHVGYVNTRGRQVSELVIEWIGNIV